MLRMGKTYEGIDGRIREFIEAQHLFFVATAPSGSDGHVNLSPKGLDGLRIVSPTEVAILDYAGSGAETIAHLRDNGRIVLMLCAFEGAPKIVRLHGKGRAIEPGDPAFAESLALFPDATVVGVRSIVRVSVERVSDSCGYGVPLYAYEGSRSQLFDWFDRKGEPAIRTYQMKNNRRSIDGLPGLRWTETAED
jgi:predicted pyridoxine 5'-phosphate oxidase superfamily flavin-nucleotide-binding protein